MQYNKNNEKKIFFLIHAGIIQICIENLDQRL